MIQIFLLSGYRLRKMAGILKRRSGSISRHKDQQIISVRHIDLPQKGRRKTHTKKSQKHKRLLG